jgi:hypothetical protein
MRRDILLLLLLGLQGCYYGGYPYYGAYPAYGDGYGYQTCCESRPIGIDARQPFE